MKTPSNDHCPHCHFLHCLQDAVEALPAYMAVETDPEMIGYLKCIGTTLHVFAETIRETEGEP